MTLFYTTSKLCAFTMCPNRDFEYRTSWYYHDFSIFSKKATLILQTFYYNFSALAMVLEKSKPVHLSKLLLSCLHTGVTGKLLMECHANGTGLLHTRRMPVGRSS